jgi:hypothetical protein
VSRRRYPVLEYTFLSFYSTKGIYRNVLVSSPAGIKMETSLLLEKKNGKDCVSQNLTCESEGTYIIVSLLDIGYFTGNNM